MISSSQDSEHAGPAGTVELYLSLADMSARQDQRAREVRFLFLAAREAQQSGFADVADICRVRLLEQNPDHPLSRFASMAEAMTDRDVITYGNELAEIYPPPKAEHLLHKYQASGFGKTPQSNVQGTPPVPPSLESSAPSSTSSASIVPPEKVRKKKKRNSAKRAKALLNHDAEESASIDLPASAVNQELEPLPFEWPQSPRPIAWRPHPLFVLVVGVLGGFVAGVWASPTVLPWILQTWSHFQR